MPYYTPTRPFLLLLIPSFICILYFSLFPQYLSNKPSFTLLLLIFRFRLYNSLAFLFSRSFTFLLLIFVSAFVLFIAFLFSRLLSNPISLHFVVCIYCAYYYIIYYVIFFTCCSVNIIYSIVIHVARSLTLLRLQCSNLHQL